MFGIKKKQADAEQAAEVEVEEKAPKKAKKVKERGLTLTALGLPPIILVVLLVLACGFAAYLQFAALMGKADQVAQRANAERLAAVVSGQATALGERVAMLARADETLAAAIAGGDLAALRSFERNTQAYLPEALGVHLILPSDSEPNPNVTPPIGYATLDLARQAEKGRTPPLELHLHGSKQAHLIAVRPLVFNDKVIASLAVSFPPATLKGWLKALKAGGDYVELTQGGSGPTLGRSGSGAAKDSEPQRGRIQGTSWQLAYWAAPNEEALASEVVGLIATFGGGAIVIAVVMFLYSLFLGKAVRRDLHAMAGFMVESSRGKRFHSYPVKLREMEQTLHEMEPVLGAIRHHDGIKEKATQGDGGMRDTMFMDLGGISVDEGDAPSQEDSK